MTTLFDFGSGMGHPLDTSFTYGTKIWGGDLKSSHDKVFEKGMKMHPMSQVKVHFSITSHVLLTKFG